MCQIRLLINKPAAKEIYYTIGLDLFDFDICHHISFAT